MAKEASEAGLRVLVLDAGPLVNAETGADLRPWTRERRTEAVKRQPIQAHHSSYWENNPTLFVDDVDNPYSNASADQFLWIRGRQVGGRSLTWGGLTLRFSDYELLAAERDGIGPSWPICYRDLAGFYDQVEDFLDVQGARDGIAQLPDGQFRDAPALTQAEEAFRAVIEHTWEGRKVIVGRGVPLAHSASSAGAQWAPKANLNNTIKRALATGNATMRPNSVVSHLIVDPRTAAIRGVACIDRETGKSFEVSGRTVVLAASTLESIRIMLNSRCAQHPGGVGNSSGLLGRYLLDHMMVWVAGRLPPNPAPPSSLGAAHSMLIPKFRNVTELSDKFARGYGIWGGMQRAAHASQPSDGWFMHALLEVLPHQDNRVEIDESKRDAWGIPVPRITMNYGDNELKMREDAVATLNEMRQAAGLSLGSYGCTKPGQYVHEMGGARMGNDPRASVLNPFNQCWDAKNLFVTDGSCFVTSGWQNPSLTMMAIAARASDYLVGEMRLARL